MLIPPEAPVDPGVRFDALARAYELSGGHIKNAVVRAAVFAAEDESPIGMSHLVRAAEQEYADLSKLAPHRRELEAVGAWPLE